MNDMLIGLKNLVFTITHPFITHPRRGHDSSKNFWMNVPSEISPSVSRRVIGREGKCNGMFKFAKVIIGGGGGFSIEIRAAPATRARRLLATSISIQTSTRIPRWRGNEVAEDGGG